MFRRLRVRMTIVYALAVSALVLVVGLGSYGLLRYYLQANTDLALKHSMAEAFSAQGIALPPVLRTAEGNWARNRGRLVPETALPPGLQKQVDAQGAANGVVPPGQAKDKELDDDAATGGHDAELAAIFVRAVGPDGVVAGGLAESPLVDGAAAAAAAVANGSDLRTVVRADGIRVRLLTFRTQQTPVALLQAGRELTDQSQVLSQLLVSILGLSCAAALLVGLASWVLAGRSLRPARLAWERQQQFVANAGHELRTPVTLIRASAEVADRMSEGGVGDRQLLADIISECDHMTALVDDLVLLSRLDAGQLELVPTPIELAVLLEDVQREFGRLTEGKGVALDVSTVECRVLADPGRLRQVILIVLDNALRHTPAGGRVAVSAARADRAVEVVIADSGVGIDAADLPHVCERFYRGADRAEHVQGSGLGLAIARSLLEAMQGEIIVQSVRGVGTTVRLTLPSAG